MSFKSIRDLLKEDPKYKIKAGMWVRRYEYGGQRVEFWRVVKSPKRSTSKDVVCSAFDDGDPLIQVEDGKTHKEGCTSHVWAQYLYPVNFLDIDDKTGCPKITDGGACLVFDFPFHQGSKEPTKDERGILLYIETRAVDYYGRLDGQHMNEAYWAILGAWRQLGFVDHGRICSDDIRDGVTAEIRRCGCWAHLTDEAHAAAAKERKERAERMWNDRVYRTTDEFNAGIPAPRNRKKG